MKENGLKKEGMRRRDFIGTSALAVGGLSMMPSFSFAAALNSELDDIGLSLTSAMDDPRSKIRIKITNDALLHEEAWEGSCRHGELQNLTYEAEKAAWHARMDELKKTLTTLNIPKEVEVLEPVSLYGYVEKGNPNIMFPHEQLDQLVLDNDRTDLYVCGHPFLAAHIVQRFRKPVAILHRSGSRMDGPAAARSIGVEGYHVHNWDELFELTRKMMVRKAMRNTKILSVTNFPGRAPFGVKGVIEMETLRSRYGVDYQYMDYPEFFGHMDLVEKDSRMLKIADRMAGRILNGALSGNMTQENIAKTILFYLATVSMMKKQDSNAFTIECFELCSSLNPWNRKFTPCFTNAWLKDLGIPAPCEADMNAFLPMAMNMYLSNKSVFMGNPTVRTADGTLRIAHSVAGLKMFGRDQNTTDYHVRSFMHAGYGATLRHRFIDHAGEKVTVARGYPCGTKILVTLGEIVDGEGTDTGRGCSNAAIVKLPNARDLHREMQNTGHHLTLVYGDYTEQIKDLGQMMKFDVAHVR